MKSTNTVVGNILEIKTAGPTLSPEESQASADSDDSSPFDLRRRLEDLPSPNEFIFPVDRVATLGRQICHKREGFLGPHEVANRIEENDEWEEREQRAGLESSFEASRPKDARARRRARARLKSLSCREDETMVIPQAGTSASPFNIIDNKLSFMESSVDKSARDDRLRLPAIAILRKQSRSSSLLEPSSSRFSHSSNGESRDVKCKTDFRNHRNFTSRDRKLKTTDFPSILPPFSFNNVQPKKFGGYRPSSSVTSKNSSSNSGSESVNVKSRRYSSVRKAGNATSEFSSPKAMTISSINETIKKMPIMSARSDIAESILPSLLPLSRLLDNDLDHQAARNTCRSCTEQVNPDETKAWDGLGKINTLVKPIVNERTSYDGFVAKTSSELQQDEPEYAEDARYQQQETPQATSTFLARSFPPESAKLAATTRDEQIICSESAAKAYNNFKRSSLEFENAQGEKEENYRCLPSKLCHGTVQHQFDFNCPTGQSNFENSDVAEEALSSQLSERYGSEDYSRSSCTAKMYLLRGTLASRKPRDDMSDRCDQEIITKVPTLALNSLDISYSTSTGSRECSTTLPLDPHALIKALSNVSLRREKQDEDVSRKRGSFYRGVNSIDTSSKASVFPSKRETWRVPNFTGSRKSLSRVSSKIPVRISSSVIIPSDNKCSECYKSENSTCETANYAVEKFIEQNDAVSESIAHCRPDTSTLTCSQICNETAEFKINDYTPRSLIPSNLQNSQSTPFADCIRDKMQRLPENKSQEGNPSKFLLKAAYSNDRDYAKIDDDIQSRSNRSTSRKSVDTADVTSATDSQGLFKYKRTELSQIEMLKNVNENVTWRTEDECASINDEDNSEDVKEIDYVCHDETSQLQDKDYKLTIEKMCGPLPLRSQQMDSSEIEKASRKRCASDDLEFNDDEVSLDENLEVAKVAQTESLARRTQEVSSSAARISSLNLNCGAKRKKKKSQERFPFTISEVSGALSLKDKDVSDNQSSDQNFNCKKTNDQPRKEAVYQLKMYPSLTGLAVSNVKDTVGDILCCVAQEKQDATSKSKVKALAKIFSLKLRKASKQLNDETPGTTKIIYENNACYADSCSGDSLTEEARKMCNDNPWVAQRATDSEPMRTSSREAPKKAENCQATAKECIRRQYDRDGLRVWDIKDPSYTGEKNSRVLQEENKANGSKESPTKDRYSIFLARNLQSNESIIPNRDDSLKEQRDALIFDHATASDEKSKRNIDRKVPSNFVFEAEDVEEEPTGCICWKLCHASRRLDIIH